LEDITILQDHGRIDMVMKDGLMYKGLMNNKSPYLVDSDKS
jgi:hypothetical protein